MLRNLDRDKIKGYREVIFRIETCYRPVGNRHLLSRLKAFRAVKIN